MGTERKVYVPRWVPWFMQLIIVPVWLWITYRVFFSDAANGDLDVGGWLVMTLMFAAVSVMTFLMGYRKLPVYVIEQEDGPGH